ncbi:MAG: hypothetical protein KJ880_04850 [Candidatus Omnitrophica bacterium]|nr:hypothetical protein [Candidatus Omnitrophota bacterium]
MGKRIAAVALLMAFSLLFIIGIAAAQEVTADKIKEVAIAAVKAKGINIEEAVVIYDDGNKLMEEHFGIVQVEEPNHGILKRGFMKNYRTVYFDFKEPIKDIWVFIDKDTGEVLEVYQE